MRHPCIATAILLALGAPCLAQPINIGTRGNVGGVETRKDIPARTELLSIDTLTLSDHQFLMGPPKEAPQEAPKDAPKDAAKDGAKEGARDAAKGGANEGAKDAVKDAAKDDAEDVAKPTTLSGVFRIAQGDGRLPVVVLMHGSGGMGRTSRRGRGRSTPWGFQPSPSTASPAAASPA